MGWPSLSIAHSGSQAEVPCFCAEVFYCISSLSHPAIHCEETLSISYLLDPVVGARNVYGERFAHGTLKDCCEGSV